MTQFLDQTLGLALKAARKAKKWTIRDLGDKLGMSFSNIGKYERFGKFREILEPINLIFSHNSNCRNNRKTRKSIGSVFERQQHRQAN